MTIYEDRMKELSAFMKGQGYQSQGYLFHHNHPEDAREPENLLG
jgi:hypothetical protein